MFFDWLPDLMTHFTVPHLPPLDSDVILIRGRRVGVPVSLLWHLGLCGLSVGGMYVVAKLYSAESEEVVLALESTGKIRMPVSAELAGGILAISEGVSPPSLDETTDEVAAPPEAGPKSVNVSTFAPRAVSPGDDFYIQIMLHSQEQLDEAKERAKELEELAHLFKSVPLRLPLKENDEIRITIEGRGANILEPEQTFVWQGHFAHIAFAVRLPGKMGQRTYKPLIRIFVNRAPAGIMEIALAAVSNVPDNVALPASEKALRFNRVFMSYASEDRAKVLDMAKMLRAQKIDFFQDLLSLEPGERWERKIYNEIANCDAFYLFWSSHAKQSKWVIQEATMALQQQRESANETPYFLPIIIEGPPVVRPPPELDEIHFNDPLQHIIFAEQVASKDRQEKRITSTES